MKKRLLSFLLVLVMVAGFVPVTARAEGAGSTDPYILNFHFKSSGNEVKASMFADIPVTSYSTEEDNEYTFGLPLEWEMPNFTLTVADGVDTDNIYCSVFRGTTKESATKAMVGVKPLSAMSGGVYHQIRTLTTVVTRDTQMYLKFVVGTGATQENPQTYYIRVVRAADINNLTYGSPGESRRNATRRNNSYYIDWTEDTINFGALASYSPTTEILLDDTVIPSEGITVDLTQYPLDADGVRTLPLKAKYTGTGYGADLDLTINIDTNHNYTPFIAPVETPVSVDKGGSLTLTAQATANKGVLTYQWYGTDWTSPNMPAIEGATEQTYSPTTAYAGEYKYNFRVTNSFDGVSIYTNSDIITVNVEPTYASEASIDGVSDDLLLIQGENKQIGVTASPKDQNAVLTYQWYVNTENSNQGGTLIDGATENSITVDSDHTGTKYYYCVVTASLELTDGTIGTNSDAVSDPVKVTVTSTSELFDGAGTSGDPYQLKTADDYNTLQRIINEGGNSMSGVYFKQMADITLPAGWTPLGRTKDGTTNLQNGANLLPFSANLDGGGHTLTIPAGNMPLLGYVKNASVSNLNIYGSQINGYGLVNNYEGVGLSGLAINIDNVTLKSGTQTLKSGLIGGNMTNSSAGAASAGFYVTISNCTVESGVTVGYDGTQSKIGGIAGRINGAITNCTSAATVKGINYVGGIVASNDNAMGSCIVTGCTFTGSVEASGEHAGGIVGGGYENSSAPNGIKLNIINCSASGSVTGANKVGGILGGDSWGFQAWNDHSITGNSFTGTVTATASGGYAGGIIGYYANLNKHDIIYNNTCSGEPYGFILSIDTSHPSYADDDTVPFGVEPTTGTYYYNSAVDDLATVDEQLVFQFDVNTGYKFVSQRNHNRTDDPLNTGGEVTATALIISGTYKTEYEIGEAFDPTGIVVTAIYSNGTGAEVDLNDVTFTGFDSSTSGKITITAAYSGVTATFKVTIKAPANENITVKFSVLGDEHHTMAEGDTGHGLWVGGLQTWLPETNYTVSANATVFDLITQAFEADDSLTFFSRYTASYNSEYIYAVDYNGLMLTEKDNWKNSGWMVAVNCVHVQVGVSNMKLADGDEVILHWCDDFYIDEAEGAHQAFLAAKPQVTAENAKDGKIKLTWEGITGAVAYEVYRSEAKAGEYTLLDTVTDAEYTKGGTIGKAYWFKVVAVNAAGEKSHESDPVKKFRVPAQVTSLKATSKGGQVTLKWKKVSGAKKYEIYMSKNGKTGWKKVGTATKNTFIYKKGKAGQKLYFRVRAVTSNGKKGEYSKNVSIKVKK